MGAGMAGRVAAEVKRGERLAVDRHGDPVAVALHRTSAPSTAAGPPETRGAGSESSLHLSKHGRKEIASRGVSPARSADAKRHSLLIPSPISSTPGTSPWHRPECRRTPERRFADARSEPAHGPSRQQHRPSRGCGPGVEAPGNRLRLVLVWGNSSHPPRHLAGRMFPSKHVQLGMPALRTTLPTP